jgi:hypothetical protein
MAYYKNTKVVSQEVGLPVSGTILVKPGYYVAGAYFAQYATALILTEETDGDTITALDAGDLDAFIVYSQPATAGVSSVGTASIIDGTIAAADIDSNAVTTAKINALAVTTAKIADLNVTTGKIADLNVTTGKIADLAVTTGKLAADAVDGTKIADDAIDSEHIAAGALDTEHYAALSVTSPKINLIGVAPTVGVTAGTAGEVRVTDSHIWVSTGGTAWKNVAITAPE